MSTHNRFYIRRNKNNSPLLISSGAMDDLRGTQKLGLIKRETFEALTY